MLYFRACPRCRTGVVELNSDQFGRYLLCLTCGMMIDLGDDESAQSALAAVHWARLLKLKAS